MSTGSNDFGSVFGIPEKKADSVPSPADIARGSSAAPLPSDLAGQAKPKRSKRRGRRDAAGDVAPSGDGRSSSDSGNGRDGGPSPDVVLAADAPELLVDDRRVRRRRMAIIAVILVLLALVSLFVDAGYARFFDPGEVFTCYGIWFEQAFLSITAPLDVTPARDIVMQHPAYFRILGRIGITAMTVVCGAVLAIAGALYQSAFRNPIAGPSMLGVSSAIQLGDVILVLIFGSSASLMLGYRYLICYVCVISVIALLFVFTRLMTGKGRGLNVVNLLLVAMIITQIVGVIVTYVTMYVFTEEEWEIFTAISEATTVNLDLLSWVVFLASCAVGLVPVLVLRFRLNGLNFEDTEMKLLGINATRLRLLALVCGTVLLMAAQVQMGTIAMLSLVIPHISRMFFGAEFRKQLGGCVLMGAALLLFCRDVVGFIPYVGEFLPVSVVLNFVVLPFFVWMLATQQRGWEQ